LTVVIEPAARDLELLSGWLTQTAEVERLGARFATLAEAVPVAVLVMTRERVVFANEHVARLLGRRAEELPETPLGLLFPDRETRASVHAALDRAWHGSPEDIRGVGLARPDGSRRHVTITLRHLSREMDPTLLVVLAETSPTPRGESVRRETSDALRVFGLYLAALANELRAPLTAHRAHLEELARRGDLPSDLRHSFELYREITTETLERFGRAMEWGRRGPLTDEIDLAATVRAAVATLERAHVFDDRIRVTLELEPVPPVLGVGDQLQIAVEHVLRNAAEALATRGGTIRARVGPDGKGRVGLTIIDDGPGIPDSLLPHVFEPFASTKSIACGLGLGLAIVKDIVSRHRGEVKIETGTTGTTVHFGLDAGAEGSSPATAVRHPRVLIVDDNPDLQETLRLLVERAGFEVLSATDAEEALTLVGAEEVDALIVDVQLSGRDGLALLEALAMWHPQLLPRVVLQTAYAYEERVQSMAARYGIRLLAKPAPVGLLLQTVRTLAAGDAS
jgi:signal transduction histidine kinase/ActR/RegA family two-component response regulator